MYVGFQFYFLANPLKTSSRQQAVIHSVNHIFFFTRENGSCKAN